MVYSCIGGFGLAIEEKIIGTIIILQQQTAVKIATLSYHEETENGYGPIIQANSLCGRL